MAARFFSVGSRSLHSDAQAESFSHSREISLDDADVIFFALPSAPYSANIYKGKPSLNSDLSFAYKELLHRWRSELNSAVASGKTVFVPLTSPEVVYVKTGDVTSSGTGRNARHTHIVAEQSNLDVLPSKLKCVATGVGNEFRTTDRSQVLGQYWTRVASISWYEIRISPQDSLVPLLTTKHPDQVVSAIFRYKGGGNLVLLPAINLKKPSPSAFRLNCIDLVRDLLGIHAELNGGAPAPPPDWAHDARYETDAQRRLRADLQEARVAEARARTKKEHLRACLEDASVLQGLLFAQGRPLEAAVIRGLKLMGIEAEGFADGESEFDAVFAIDGQRMLGEAEGRDRKAIAIGKITQLERNVAEDFARDDVDVYAHGVLFGNPQRLVAPGERTEAFTEKCISSAERNRFALVLTYTMFGPAGYLEASGDADYAAACRAAITASKGQVVKFPEVPSDGRSYRTSEPETTTATGG